MGKNAHLLTTTRGTVETWRQNEGEEEGAKWGGLGLGEEEGLEGPGELSQERRRTPLL